MGTDVFGIRDFPKELGVEGRRPLRLSAVREVGEAAAQKLIRLNPRYQRLN